MLGDNPDLTVVQGDYDGDTVTESVSDELTGLIDTRVHVVVANTDGLVLSINHLDYVDNELPSAPTPSGH